MFECLAALKVDRLKSECQSVKRFVELKEEEEEQDEEEADDHYDDNNDELFSLELERGERGLGLALVDTRVRERDVDLRILILVDKGAADLKLPTAEGNTGIQSSLSAVEL